MTKNHCTVYDGINFLYILFILLFSTILIHAQDEEYQIGINPNLVRPTAGGYYDYSEPEGINIKVAVWGYVKFPGKYVVPQRSDIKDLISYAGGISDDTNLSDLRIYRRNVNSEQILLRFDYEDLWWGEKLNSKLDDSKLIAGDILIVPGRPRLYWEDYYTLILSSLGFLISVATLIITATN